MIDLKEYKQALAEFLEQIKCSWAEQKLEKLSKVIDQLEDDLDIINCIGMVITLSARIQYQFIHYIIKYHGYDNLAYEKSKDWTFQGYVANVLLLQKNTEFEKEAAVLFKQLILSLYSDNEQQVDDLFKWLNEGCPTHQKGNKRIGNGSGGEVYQESEGVIKVFGVRYLTNNGFYESPGKLTEILNEVILLRLLKDAPHIIQIDKVDLSCHSPRIKMELADAGNLFKFIQKNQQYVKEHHLDFMLQILSALVYIHDKGIAHCDIKTENIGLLRNNQGGYTLKLYDFGAGKKKSSIKIHSSIMTTFGYAAPEVLEDHTNVLIDLALADIYSAAVVWAMMFLKYEHPYPGIETSQSLTKEFVAIQRNRPVNQLPNYCHATLNHMWAHHPEDRANASAAKDQIEKLQQENNSTVSSNPCCN